MMIVASKKIDKNNMTYYHLKCCNLLETHFDAHDLFYSQQVTLIFCSNDPVYL